MSQPRFGGVATLSLSQPSGEGKFESKMESRDAPCRSVLQNGEAVQMETGQEGVYPAMEDPKVKKVLEVLWNLNILVSVEQHRPKHERQKDSACQSNLAGEVYCKNLLLKDKKGQVYLIICDEADTADLHVVKYHLNVAGNFHFASSSSTWNLLGVRPGAVTPLAFIHSSARGVRLLMDATLVARIDRDATKLFFHPLRPELQVGLTLSELEKFLNHCDATLEMLPSLRTYGARRQYNLAGNSSRFQRRSHKENGPPAGGKSKVDITEASQNAAKPVKLKQQAAEPTEQGDEFLLQHKILFEELKINVGVTPLSDTGDPCLSCKCVYLKDKKNNYFLFICHEKQKVDFSNLKTQLKPSKKITPLDSAELSSLLNLHGDRPNPFLLAGLKQPRFLVAIADNLYQRRSAVLTFPHPSCSVVHIQVTLKDVEAFVRGVGHDLVTIPVKGTLESISVSTPASASPKPTTLRLEETTMKEETKPSDITKNTVVPLSSDLTQISSTIPSGQEGNLFYRLMTPLRDWMARCIRRFILLLSNYLPRQITPPLLQHLVYWQQATTPTSKTTKESTDPPSYQEGLTREQEAKLAKLRQLISEASIPIKMLKMKTKSKFHISEAEQCKIHLLRNKNGHPYAVLSAEKDIMSDDDYLHLRREFMSRSALSPVTSDDIKQHLQRQEGEANLSWAPEELSPLLLMNLDQQAWQQVQVGVRQALYCFPDTTIAFDLPSLGVTLCLSFDDLERMLKKKGFCVLYLP